MTLLLLNCKRYKPYNLLLLQNDNIIGNGFSKIFPSMIILHWLVKIVRGRIQVIAQPHEYESFNFFLCRPLISFSTFFSLSSRFQRNNSPRTVGESNLDLVAVSAAASASVQRDSKPVSHGVGRPGTLPALAGLQRNSGSAVIIRSNS